MGRLAGLSAAQVRAAVTRPVLFLRLAFPSETLRLCDRAGSTFTYNAETYTGDGTILALPRVSDRIDGRIPSVTLTLSAGHARLRERFARDAWSYSSVEIAEGFLGEDGQLVGPPYSYGSFLMSSGEQENGRISLICEPSAIRLMRASLVMSSHADQQVRYSGDTFFKYAAALEDREIAWGGSRGIIYTTGGAGSGVGSWGGAAFGTYTQDLIDSPRIQPP